MTKEQVAEELRKLHDEHVFDVRKLKALADELDPPSKIDTTLRGWVMVMDGSGREFVWWAREDGLYGARGHSLVEWTWDRLTDTPWTVRALTPEDIGFKVRRWDEWSGKDRDEWVWARSSNGYQGEVDLAIDIATRSMKQGE